MKRRYLKLKTKRRHINLSHGAMATVIGKPSKEMIDALNKMCEIAYRTVKKDKAMTRIKLTCQTCGLVHELPKTPEIPEHVFAMKCNWCPACEDRAEGYYNEWYDDDENDPDNIPVPVGDNQLCMPFEFEELEKEFIQEHEYNEDLYD